jgi:hypothetical protein
MDANEDCCSDENDKQRHMMDLGVDVLKQLSNKSHEEQLLNAGAHSDAATEQTKRKVNNERI